MNQSARFAAAILKQIRVLPGGDKKVTALQGLPY